MSNILFAKSYEEIIENDLENMWAINRFCKARPWIETMMNRIVSKHPLQDICLVLWIVFIVGWIEAGHSHFWVCAMNATVVMLARRIIEAKRPVEYDRRLRPRTEVNPESYGFPSVETHMTVVIFGHLYLSYLAHHSEQGLHGKPQKRFAFFSTSTFAPTTTAATSTDTHSNNASVEMTIMKSIFAYLFSPYMIASLLLAMTIFMSFLVGFSRIYSASRFPHQIAGSYITGLVGLLVSRQCCEHMAFHKMRDFEHYSCMIFIVIGILANVALNMENNDSRLLNVPKKEFLRVICDILSSSRSGDAVLANALDGEGAPGGENDDNRAGGRNGTMLSPRAAALREAQDRRTRQTLNGNGFGTRSRRYVKSDSLYFLQKGMEERERRQQAALQASVLGQQGQSITDDRRKGRKYYGAEDFYSSDNDYGSDTASANNVGGKAYYRASTSASYGNSNTSNVKNRFRTPDI